MLLLQGVPPLGGVKQGCGGGKQAILKLDASISISKTVGDIHGQSYY